MKTEQTKLKINELMEHFNIKNVSEFAKLTVITQSNFSRYLSGDRRRVSDKTHKGSIEISVTANGKRKRIPTGVTVYPNEWKNGKVINRRDANLLNDKIEKLYDAFSAVLSVPNFEMDKLSTESVKTQQNASMSLREYMTKSLADNNTIVEGIVSLDKRMA